MRSRYHFTIVSTLAVCACHQAARETTANTGANTRQDSISIALAAMDQRIIGAPGTAALYAERARLWLRIDSARRATADYERAVMLDSGNVEYHLALGDLYHSAVKLDRSQAQFRKALSIDPKNTAALLRLAETELVLRNYPHSMELVNEALRIDEHAARGYFLKGWIHMETHDTALALSSFHTAVEQDPDDYDAYIILGKLSAARHDPLAEQFYNTALQLRPRSVEAWYDKGICCQNNGEDSLALDCYQHIMAIDSMNATAWYNSGWVRLNHLQDYPRAKQDFSHAIDLQPRLADAWYNRGVAEEYMNNPDSAAANYEVCLGLVPQHTLAAEGLDRMAKKGAFIKIKRPQTSMRSR